MLLQFLGMGQQPRLEIMIRLEMGLTAPAKTSSSLPRPSGPSAVVMASRRHLPCTVMDSRSHPLARVVPLPRVPCFSSLAKGVLDKPGGKYYFLLDLRLIILARFGSDVLFFALLTHRLVSFRVYLDFLQRLVFSVIRISRFNGLGPRIVSAFRHSISSHWLKYCRLC